MLGIIYTEVREDGLCSQRAPSPRGEKTYSYNVVGVMIKRHRVSEWKCLEVEGEGRVSGFQGLLKKVVPLLSLTTCLVLASQTSCEALVRQSLGKGLVN